MPIQLLRRLLVESLIMAFFESFENVYYGLHLPRADPISGILKCDHFSGQRYTHILKPQRHHPHTSSPKNL